MKSQHLFWFCLFFILPSCAPKEFNEPGILPATSEPTKKSFVGSYGDVWNATLSALQSKKYTVGSASRDSGAITTDWILGKSDRLYSGYGDTRIPYNIRFKLTLHLRPSRSGVEVKVSNEEQYYSDSVTAGTDFTGSLYQWLPTESSRAKEGGLLAEIETQLAARKSGANK
ncbi:MAG TPA: outer membrane protein assembly factor BamC [Bdellovibrionota bacterium]|nr:outer membrane protein assembly factor BamC [Bdellovibrionota bacterium]